MYMNLNLNWASLIYCFMCSLLMYVCRLHIACVWVPVGTPLSQYGVRWAICIFGVLVGLSKKAPWFASCSSISLPIMHVCALIFWIVVLCVDHVI